MKKRTSWWLALVTAAGALGRSASAQETNKENEGADWSFYELKREVSLNDTVLAFDRAAQTAPGGAYVVQTAGGVVDVHVGDARLLTANHFLIVSGDTLRIVGENVAYGKSMQFVRRLVQHDSRVLELRCLRGLPLSYVGRSAVPAKTQGGVL